MDTPQPVSQINKSIINKTYLCSQFCDKFKYAMSCICCICIKCDKYDQEYKDMEAFDELKKFINKNFKSLSPLHFITLILDEIIFTHNIIKQLKSQNNDKLPQFDNFFEKDNLLKCKCCNKDINDDILEMFYNNKNIGSNINYNNHFTKKFDVTDFFDKNSKYINENIELHWLYKQNHMKCIMKMYIINYRFKLPVNIDCDKAIKLIDKYYD